MATGIFDQIRFNALAGHELRMEEVTAIQAIDPNAYMVPLLDRDGHVRPLFYKHRPQYPDAIRMFDKDGNVCLLFYKGRPLEWGK